MKKKGKGEHIHTHTKEINEIHKMNKKKNKFINWKKCDYLYVKPHEVCIRFILKFPYSLFHSFLSSPYLSQFFLQMQTKTKICHYTLVKSLTFSCLHIKIIINKTEKNTIKYHASKKHFIIEWNESIYFQKKPPPEYTQLTFFWQSLICFVPFILFTHENLIILRIFLLCILAIKSTYLYTKYK